MPMAAKGDNQGVFGQAFGEQAECYYLNGSSGAIRCNVFNGTVWGRDGRGRTTTRQFRESWGACEVSEEGVRCFPINGLTS